MQARTTSFMLRTLDCSERQIAKINSLMSDVQAEVLKCNGAGKAALITFSVTVEAVDLGADEEAAA